MAVALIDTSIERFIENIESYIEFAKNETIVIARDCENEIVLVKKDKIKSLK